MVVKIPKAEKIRRRKLQPFNSGVSQITLIQERERECVRREWHARGSLHVVKYATIARRTNIFTKSDQASKPLSAFGFEGTVNSLFFAMIFLAPSHYIPASSPLSPPFSSCSASQMTFSATSTSFARSSSPLAPPSSYIAWDSSSSAECGRCCICCAARRWLSWASMREAVLGFRSLARC